MVLNLNQVKNSKIEKTIRKKLLYNSNIEGNEEIHIRRNQCINITKKLQKRFKRYTRESVRQRQRRKIIRIHTQYERIKRRIVLKNNF